MFLLVYLYAERKGPGPKGASNDNSLFVATNTDSESPRPPRLRTSRGHLKASRLHVVITRVPNLDM